MKPAVCVPGWWWKVTKRLTKTSLSLTLKLKKSQLLIIKEIEKSCGISRFVESEKIDEAIKPSSGGNNALRKEIESINKDLIDIIVENIWRNGIIKRSTNRRSLHQNLRVQLL